VLIISMTRGQANIKCVAFIYIVKIQYFMNFRTSQFMLHVVSKQRYFIALTVILVKAVATHHLILSLFFCLLTFLNYCFLINYFVKLCLMIICLFLIPWNLLSKFLFRVLRDGLFPRNVKRTFIAY